MGAGALYLVAKYRVNTCYQPDLQGEDGTPAFVRDGGGCRSPHESIAVSDPVSVQFVDRNFGAPTRFSFRDTAPIPMNVSDLSLQVVFRGHLGQEQDAIAVSTLNVAEPNYFAVGNITDYVFDDAVNVYRKIPYNLNTTDVTLNTVQFALRDPAMGSPLATLTDMHGGEHAQLAFITDRVTTKIWLRSTSTPQYLQYDNVPWQLNEFSYDESGLSPVYGRTCAVINQRGQWRQIAYHYAQLTYGVVPRDANADDDVVGIPNGPTLKGLHPKYEAGCPTNVPPGSGGLLDLSVLQPAYMTGTQKQWAITY